MLLLPSNPTIKSPSSLSSRATSKGITLLDRLLSSLSAPRAPMAELECLRLLNPWLLHLQKLGLELKCPSCLDLYNEPILLPCNHIFCGSCIFNVSFGLECTLCKSSFCMQAVRKAPYMESIVNLYRSLHSSFSNHMEQLRLPGTSTSSHFAFEKTLLSADMKGTNSSATNDNKGFQICVHPSSLTPSSQTGLKRHQLLEAMDLDPEHHKQLSPDSSPSFGFNKSDIGCDDYGMENHPAKKSKTSIDGSVVDQLAHLSTHVADNPSPRIQVQNQLSDDVLKQAKISSPSNILNSNDALAGNMQLETTTFSGAQPANLTEDLSESSNFTCGFCQTWKVTEYTGCMLHYTNGVGKPVAPEEAACSDVIHVHSKCIDWAPQTYYVGENVKNLNKELSRGAKLKCNKCGLKGAALGCYAKSCKRSYHAPCAAEIQECRWDMDNFLVLCPAHVSMKFPNEKGVKRALENSKDSITVDKGQQVKTNFWAASSKEAQNWTFCGSSLSADEKNIMVKFASMCGANLAKSWNPNVTHVIAATDASGACTRTLKVLMAILKGRWILKLDWVKACMEEKQHVDEEAYEVSLDNHGCYDGPRMGRLRILNNAPKLFAGLKFYFTGEFVSKYKEDLLSLIMAAGGVTVDNKGELVVHPVYGCEYSSTNTHHLVIYNNDAASAMGVESDLFQQRIEAAKMVAIETGSKTIPHTWILDSIASCKLQPLA